jgi:MFS transporter, putative metabolite:H+ symporter
MVTPAIALDTAHSVESVIARLERLPISRELTVARIVIGSATFFDAYTILAIAYAMPVLAREWNLTPGQIGTIISAGYLGQVFGALFFGWLAERIGRLNVLLITVVIFTSMDLACLFAWNASSMMIFRFCQGIGTGGEVPVASAYMNEFVSAKRRGRFFLLYEVLFLFGLLAAGLIGYFLVPIYGWRAMFIVGLVPAILTIPMRWFMVESPRWLLSVGRVQPASDLVARMEDGFRRRGISLEKPTAAVHPLDKARSDIRELFKGIYLRRTVLLTALWVCSYMIANGLITWLPTLYRQIFELPLQTSLAYGFTTSAVGCAAALLCALYIDKVGRKVWYTLAFFLAAVPMAILAALGATSAHEVLIFVTATYAIIQTVTFSLYLYSAELYPTRLRAVGAGFGSAWLRVASSIGPLLVGWVVGSYSIDYVFVVFGIVLVIGGLICLLFAPETKGRVLEELSP